MQCKSLWIKASAKCINVNVNGTNVIKLLAHRMKGDSDYCRLVSNQTVEAMAGCQVKSPLFI